MQKKNFWKSKLSSYEGFFLILIKMKWNNQLENINHLAVAGAENCIRGVLSTAAAADAAADHNYHSVVAAKYLKELSNVEYNR